MLHMIGNAHLDPVWLWRWQEGCAEAIGTCWSAVDRLDEGGAFVFTRGEASVYAWIEEYEPALFARIRDHVQAGRWVVVNGWWVQPDCNLPSGESFIRQGLVGKAWFRDRFGVDVTVGYNVDSFGHAHTLPMLLRHTGFDSYVFMRPGPHEMALPGELFEWVSPDGSGVAAFRIAIAYHTSPRQIPLDEKIDRHQAMEQAAGHPFMCFYGVGNHGGGPTRESVATIAGRTAEGVAFSDPARFFAAVSGTAMPRVDGELQFHAIGCYAVASRLKKLNRQAEARLEQAETAAALAMMVAGAPCPAVVLGELWRTLLFNQFHDTLGGTAIESACDDSEREMSGVVARADVLINGAVRHLARTVAPVDDPRDPTLFIAHTNPARSDGLVEAEPWTDFDAVSPRVLVDEDGADVPFQFIAPEGKTRGLQRIVFRLDAPGYGYRLLRFPVRAGGTVPPGVQWGRATERRRWDTPGWAMAIDPATGAITSLMDRATGRELFSGPAAQLIAVEDRTDTWSHGIDRFGVAGEPFSLVSVSEVEDGPIRLGVEVMSRSGAGTCVTTILLPGEAGLPVEVRFRVTWHGRNTLLRVAFPMAGSRFEYEVPAGWSERPDDGREVFGHRWVRAVRPDGSATVLANDAKYSYAALDGTLYLTALRSPVFAHHDPVELEPGRSYRWMDAGEHAWTMRILPDGTRAAAMALADGLMKPPVATPQVSRGGTASHRGQWLAVSAGDTGAVTALKAAEDGRGVILRAVELDGVAARLEAPGGTVALRARGVASARLAGDTLRETDGLEG